MKSFIALALVEDDGRGEPVAGGGGSRGGVPAVEENLRRRVRKVKQGRISREGEKRSDERSDELRRQVCLLNTCRYC